MSETYQPGEYIRYAVNGVCQIEDIRQDAMFRREAKKEFYVLRPIASPNSTILVPTDSAPLLAKMSRLPSPEELNAMILSTKDQTIPWIEDRKVRGAEFQTIVKRCDLQELISLVSCIYHRRQDLLAAGKKLSASDENILRRAEELIENEIAFVLKLETAQVGEYIREQLDID